MKSQNDFSKLSYFFQQNFSQKFFSRFLNQIQNNFLAFDYALQNLIKLEVSREEAQEDPRTKYSDYPSA